MIPLLDKYQLVTPGSLAEALDDLAAHPEARPFAGGTDLMVLLEAGHLPPGRYVSLQSCRELFGIEDSATGVSIGALTTYTEIRSSSRLSRDYALLPHAARETGGLATQNRGTIGGNIANASPAADTPPALLVYDAELELVSTSGTRRVLYAAFHRGYKKMDLAPGELIGRVHLPFRRGAIADTRDLLPSRGSDDVWRDYYRKVGTRRAQAISKVCFAGAILMDGNAVAAGSDRIVKDVRIALGSVAPIVIRATRTEAALRGSRLDAATIAAAQQTLISEIAPIDDIRSTARYRTRVAANLIAEFLNQG
jgi:CO/xanthine dehydrogenase FAD-binding subunit